MEMCPEIVVLQSAFQLLEKEVGDGLCIMKKACCSKTVPIISTAVYEITHGLQCDHNTDQVLHWTQKLHSLIFYTLARNKYETKLQRHSEGIVPSYSEGTVPSYSTLEMMTQLLPSFSSDFYFELMKECNWTALFLQSLTYVSQNVADCLLTDLLTHCQHQPVTKADDKVITMVTDTLLARCIYVPDEAPAVVRDLLQSLTFHTHYIQTMYPDVAMTTYVDEPITMETNVVQAVDKDCVNCKVVMRAGPYFWDSYVESHPDMFTLVLQHTQCRNTEARGPIGACQDNPAIDQMAAKFAFIFYLHTCANNMENNCNWLINNLFGDDKKVDVAGTTDSTSRVEFMVNTRLVTLLANQIPVQTLNRNIHKIIDDLVQLEVNNVCSDIEVFPGLLVKSVSLRRLLHEGKVMDTDVGDNTHCTQVVFGEDWSRDITLDALLWRIHNNLPHGNVCMEILLEKQCWHFWQLDRLWNIVGARQDLLSKQRSILQLLDILQYYTSQPVDITRRLQHLIFAAFSQLSFPSQDSVIMEIYCNHSFNMRTMLAECTHANLTNTFNKVTGDKDTQVLSEIFEACLIDPLSTIQFLLETSCKNEQQASNMANVLDSLQKTCACRHPRYPHTALLVAVISEFLQHNSLDVKQEKCFITFMSHILSDTGKLVLSASEFLMVTVIPLLSTVSVFTAVTLESPISAQFALSLLTLGLSAVVCKEHWSWSDCAFEPVSLLVILAQMLHECCVIWEEETQSEEHTQITAGDTSTSKLAVKQLCVNCMTSVAEMVQMSSVADGDLEWLMSTTSELHWSVRLRLFSIITTCGHNIEGSVPDSIMKDRDMDLLAVLQLAALGKHHTHNHAASLDYHVCMETLLQLLPELTVDEGIRAIEYIHCLISAGASYDWTYRLDFNTSIPLKHIADLQPVLYTSQLLSDVIVAMEMVWYPGHVKCAVLQHVVHIYAKYVQSLCEEMLGSSRQQLLGLCEIFHHVCHVTFKCQVKDSALLLLLHIVNKFKHTMVNNGETGTSESGTSESVRGVPVENEDMSQVTCGIKSHTIQTQRDVKRLKTNSNTLPGVYVNKLEIGMLRAIGLLPDCYEEKHMLLKKLTDSSR